MLRTKGEAGVRRNKAGAGSTRVWTLFSREKGTRKRFFGKEKDVISFAFRKPNSTFF